MDYAAHSLAANGHGLRCQLYDHATPQGRWGGIVYGGRGDTPNGAGRAPIPSVNIFLTLHTFWGLECVRNKGLEGSGSVLIMVWHGKPVKREARGAGRAS